MNKPIKYFKKKHASNCFDLTIDKVKLLKKTKINLLFVSTGRNPEPELEYIKFLKKLGIKINNIYFIDPIYSMISEKELFKIFKDILPLKYRLYFFSSNKIVFDHLKRNNITINIFASFNFQIASDDYDKILQDVRNFELLVEYLYEKNNNIVSFICSTINEEFKFNIDIVETIYNVTRKENRILNLRKIDNLYFFESYNTSN